MSANPRPRRLAGLVAVVLLGLMVWTQLPSQGRASEILDRAERLYQADKLLQAEPLFRKALDSESLAGQRFCFERLLAVHVRLGRLDQAIQFGQRYRQWLLERNEPDRIREVTAELGGWYCTLGHFHEGEKLLTQALDRSAPGAYLPDLKRLQALLQMARGAEQAGDHEKAHRCWREVEEVGLALLADQRLDLLSRDRIAIGRTLAEGYQFQKQPRKAVAQLTALLRWHDEAADPLDLRDTLRKLAANQATVGDLGAAETNIRHALRLHENSGSSDVLTHGQLAQELAELLQQGTNAPRSPDRAAEARRWLTRAIADYEAVLGDGRLGQPGVAGAVSAFWKLQALYQEQSQYDRALKLAVEQGEQWGGLLLQPRLKTEQGSLELILSAFARARTALRTAVAAMDQQAPLNLIELPRACNNLAFAELASNEVDRAERLGQKNLDLYRRFALPDDAIVVETHDLLGSCAALHGDYSLAIERYRKGIALCQQLGPVADPQRSNLLLNVALLHKGQGDLEEALRVCEEAREVYGRFARPDSLGMAAFDAARVNLLLAQGRITAVWELSQNILKLCAKHDIRRGPLIITARHGLALAHLERGELTLAEEELRIVLALQEEDNSPLRPRTLNYLGLIAELRKNPEEAARSFEQAAALQKNNPRAFPATQFITLWRLAGIARQRGERKQAQQMLEEAMTVVETARLQTYGDARQRAIFFAQFEPAYAQLQEWGLRDGDFDTALVAAVRGRSRTLLDQLQAVSVDPRAGLAGPRGKELLAQEAQWRQRLSALRARALLIADSAFSDAEIQQLLLAHDEARQRYAETWREILNLSPAYRAVPADDRSRQDLEVLRNQVLGPKTIVLVYSIGRDRSCVFLLGDRSVHPEVFMLQVPVEVDRQAGEPALASPESSLRGTRGLGLKIKRPAALAPPAVPSGTNVVPLRLPVARALVDEYLEVVSDPDFRPTRGFQIRPRKANEPAPVQRIELLADVFAPPALRQRLGQLHPECLVIVPDGPLHKLPLEALVVEGGDRPRYLLDEWPPMVYAPSLATLTLLAKRPASGSGVVLSLLTVSDPAYRTPVAPVPEAPPGRLPQLLEMARGLPLLPGTAEESRAIRSHFAAEGVTALSRDRATRPAVAAALPGKRFIHLAAHCFADDRFGNLFGGLILTPVPPSLAGPGDDGFLSLPEICTLPLNDCELAILSACVTNVGPQQPLEAGVTLANGFLAAGARRIIASQWDVDDRATAVLMDAFVAAVAPAAQHGQRLACAQALRQARLRVRANPGWTAPFYWAPFVLLGPPE